jgi:glycosyltransferase involved in cell wall biosynthesis
VASDEHLAGNGEQVAVLVPCYNEQRAVAKVVADFQAALSEATAYVYENNSTDGTVEAARRGRIGSPRDLSG